MRILVAATSSRGGAGIAARRSYLALSEAGIDSVFITLDSQESINQIKRILPKRLLGTFLRKSVTVIQTKIVQNSSRLMTPISFNASKWLFNVPKEDFDVLHLHAFYNLVSVKEIERLCKEFSRVVITLHDERMFTGGCHYAGTCNGFHSDCSNCPLVGPLFKRIPEVSLRTSIQSLKNIKNLEFVAPSQWLADRAGLSNVLENRKVHVIQNPIPEVFFEGKIKSRSMSEKLVIGFSSYDLQNPHKGFPILVDAIGLLSEKDRERIELKIATQSFNIPIIGGLTPEVDSPTSDVELKAFYKKIDLLIVPSTEDNSPSVLGEALASGVRILGSRIGGIPELLEKFNQTIVTTGDASELANSISQIIDEESAEIDFHEVRSVFSESTYVQKVLKLYEN